MKPSNNRANETFDIVIIGGGASGLMLAAQLDLNELRTADGDRTAGSEELRGKSCGGAACAGLLLEGSSVLGSKLLMSGGGHCNITHGGAARELVFAYGSEGSLLRRCLYRHNNFELAQWLDQRGVTLADENGEELDLSAGIRAMNDAGRIFPKSMKSRDVLDALAAAASEHGWEIRTGAKVSALEMCTDRKAGMEAGEQARESEADPGSGEQARESEADPGAELPVSESWRIRLKDGRTITARCVVVASGGITYPETGSDGSMLDILSGLGVQINRPRPALAPVYVKDYPYSDLAGISLTDVTVLAFSSDASCTCKGKAARMKGDMLFTHEGLSGPVILNISRYVEDGETIRLCYNKEITDLPKRMQRILRDRARGPLGDVRTNVLASLLDHDDFVVKGVDARGMVTAGGVALEEIDMTAMKLKRFSRSLYIIGEALDADGITGGYNLQLCWSTAGACADSLRDLF